MKKIGVIVIMLVSFIGFSQPTQKENNNLKKTEIKSNMSNLIIFKWFDGSYEKIINKETSLGVGVLFSVNNSKDNAVTDAYRTFSLTPYYRHFLSKKYAQGFFIEGFGMLHSGKDEIFVIEDTSTGFGRSENKTYTDLAFGISVGTKFVTKKGFVAEIYLGMGRDLFGSSIGDNVGVGRGGISVGYRF